MPFFSKPDTFFGDKTGFVIVIVALSANLVIATAKLGAALISGSSAVLAEAAHSDRSHPFGYGMERYFWTFMASIFMFVVGGSFSIFQGISRVLSPQELEQIGLSYVVLGMALIFDGVSFSLAFRGLRRHLSELGWWQSLRQTKDPTLFTVLLEDSTALAGVAVALAGLLLYQLMGLAIFDAAASIIIGLLLGVMAVLLAIESRSLLLGEAASVETQRRIREAIVLQPEVTGIVDMLTMHLSPQDILVAVELNLKDGLTTDQIEVTVDRVEEAVRKVVPEATRIFIECEPSRRIRPLRTRE